MTLSVDLSRDCVGEEEKAQRKSISDVFLLNAKVICLAQKELFFYPR